MSNRLKFILKKIAELLNDQNITWAVGASVMLNYYGIIQGPGDIDILVELKDIHKLDNILSEIGEKQEKLPNKIYKTRYFYEYIIDGIEIDVMAGLCICFDNRDHSFDFTKDSIGDFMEIDNIKVPLSKLTDWYDIYKLLPGREEKVSLIEEYMRNH
ncbi:nucleotidyltransferase family protein [Fusobacteria bacterium ZRK30]|nr:nucleotidyltransferase family protein [Fusobacteria bacterium ZRK30]